MNAVVIATGCVFHHELSRMLRKTNEKTARQTSPTNVQVILATLIMNWRSRGDSAFSTLAFVLSTPLRTPTIGPRIAPANPTDAAAFAVALPFAAAALTVAALAVVANTG